MSSGGSYVYNIITFIVLIIILFFICMYVLTQKFLLINQSIFPYIFIGIIFILIIFIFLSYSTSKSRVEKGNENVSLNGGPIHYQIILNEEIETDKYVLQVDPKNKYLIEIDFKGVRCYSNSNICTEDIYYKKMINLSLLDTNIMVSNPMELDVYKNKDLVITLTCSQTELIINVQNKCNEKCKINANLYLNVNTFNICT
jgi:energy-coupling factor transporter transmembrane protein EcfT